MSSKHWAFVAAVAVSGVLFVNWCAVVFQCGCRSLWNGVSVACNIHAAAGPHCPWCEHPLAGGGIAFFAMLAAQYLVIYRWSLSGFARRFGLAMIAFPIVTGVVALAQGWVWGYWSR